MQEAKTYMRAPEGVTSANIEGHAYKVPKDGIIEVVNGTHIPTLRRHHFGDCDGPKEDLAAKIEDMDDKNELVAFIEERGGTADADMSMKKLRKAAHEILEG